MRTSKLNKNLRIEALSSVNINNYKLSPIISENISNQTPRITSLNSTH